MAAKKRIRFQLGDVFEIPLPNGKFAYGRIYDDAGVGIYKFVSDLPNNPPIGLRKFLFNVGMYEDILRHGEWKIVGNDPFTDKESRFPPPTYIKDSITGEYSIYHRGEIKSASRAEAARLEEAAVWDSHHIIERVMKIIRSSTRMRPRNH